MSEPEPEVVEVASRALALRPEPASIVKQTVATIEVVAAQEAYHELCKQLLDKSDYQTIGKKDFRKKSGWRKLAVAFNVSVELISREYERDATGRIVRAEVVARATAPNGRTMDGLGACDIFEKCCGQAYGEPCANKSNYHKHCVLGCSGRAHFSNPQHDLPATAHTRATNRACADLFGMGEVSAEEITDNHRDYGDEQNNEPPAQIVSEEVARGLEVRIKALPEEAKKDLQTRWAQPAALKGAAMTIPGLYRLTEPQAKLVESLVRGVENAAKKDGYDKAAETAKVEESMQSEQTDTPPPDEPTAEQVAESAGPESTVEEAERVKAMDIKDVRAALVERGISIDGSNAETQRKKLTIALLKDRLAAKAQS